MDETAPAVRIPIGEVVRGAYGALFGNPGAFVRAIWPWYLLLFVFGVLAALSDGAGGIAWVVFLVGVIGFVPIAIAWHRFVLLGEAIGWTTTVRFRRRELRYLGTAAILFVPIAALWLVVFVGYALIARQGWSAMTWLIVGLPATVATFWVIARLSLAFPSVAVDGGPRPLVWSWHESKGRAARLFAAIVLATLPAGLVANLLEWRLGRVASAAEALVLAFLFLVALFAQAVLAVAVASHCYKALFGPAASGAEAESVPCEPRSAPGSD